MSRNNIRHFNRFFNHFNIHKTNILKSDFKLFPYKIWQKTKDKIGKINRYKLFVSRTPLITVYSNFYLDLTKVVIVFDS